MEGYALEVLNSLTGGSVDNVMSGDTTERLTRKTLESIIETRVIDMNNFQHVLYPLGKEYGDMTSNAPASLQYYDLVTEPLNKLRGEDLTAPFSYTAATINQAAISSFADEKNKAFRTAFDSAMNEYAMKVALPDPANPEMPAPPDLSAIQAYVDSSVKDKVEIDANHRLSYLRPYLNLDMVFNEGWDLFNKYGTQIYYTGTKNKNPTCRLVKRDCIHYDQSGVNRNISTAQWVIEWRSLSYSEVLNEYGDILSEKPDLLKKLDEDKGTNSNGKLSVIHEGLMSNSSIGNIGTYTSNALASISEVHLHWIGNTRIGFYEYELDGEILTGRVEDGDDIDPSYEIEWEWVNIVYEAVILNGEHVLFARPRKTQYRSIDNIQSVRVPYSGTSMVSVSAVLPAVPLIYKYCEYMYKINLEVAKSLGNVLFFDVALMPNTKTVGVPEWFHVLKNQSVCFYDSRNGTVVNPATGETVQARASMFTSVDMGISNTIATLINLAEKTASDIRDLIGFNDQRSGDVGRSETATGVNTALTQAKAATAYRTFFHSIIKLDVLTNLIEESKEAWATGTKIKYISDGITTIHTLIGETINSEVGVFVSNDSKFAQIRGLLHQSAAAMLQATQSNPNNQASTGAIFKALNSNSIAETISILEQSRSQLNAETQAQAKAAEEARSAQAAQAMEAAQIEADKQREWLSAEAQLDRDNVLLNTAAKLGQPVLEDNTDDNMNQESDRVLEQSRILYEAANKKRDSDNNKSIKEKEYSLKQQELDFKERDSKRRDATKRKEIDSKNYVAKVNKN